MRTRQKKDISVHWCLTYGNIQVEVRGSHSYFLRSKGGMYNEQKEKSPGVFHSWQSVYGQLMSFPGANSLGKSAGQCQDIQLWPLFLNTCPTAACDASAWHYNTKTQREMFALQTWHHIKGGGDADK